MPEELETILRLVADGRLTPEEAAPIIEALTRAAKAQDQAAPAGEARGAADARSRSGGGRHLRIRVTERGRQVVNLRVPIGFVDTALAFVPGLGGDQSARILEAVRSGTTGPIIDVEEPEGSGVLISVE